MTSGTGVVTRNILTIDYEDWFHLLRPDAVDPSTWERVPTHVESDTLKLLDLLETYRAHATFFVVGWLGERTPRMLREIVGRGHSLGSHGYYHRRPNRMSRSEFINDLARSVETIQGETGVRVVGYRAPGFAVRDCTFPYIDILRGWGFVYDSSVFPGLFPGRTQRGVPVSPYHPDPADSQFWEVPVSAVRVLGVSLAFSGGGFLRLLPAWLIRYSSRRLAANGLPAVYYVHPRDVNPEGPTLKAPWWNRFRYYGGRNSVVSKIRQILGNGQTISIEEFLAGDNGLGAQ